MPPVHKPLKNDGPACRVCGCTERNACVIDTAADVLPLTERIAKAVRMPATRMPRILTCSWVKTEAGTEPLCSACSGTAEDLAEVILRMAAYIRQHGEKAHKLVGTVAIAASLRHRKRRKIAS